MKAFLITMIVFNLLEAGFEWCKAATYDQWQPQKLSKGTYGFTTIVCIGIAIWALVLLGEV